MKPYQSQAWLFKRLYIDKKTPKEIATECGVTFQTIYNQMKKFGFK